MYEQTTLKLTFKYSCSSIIIFLYGPTAPAGPGPPHYRGFTIKVRQRTLWTSDQPDAETSTWQQTNNHNRQTSMATAGFETAFPESERPQTVP